jgi:hypothetical protein
MCAEGTFHDELNINDTGYGDSSLPAGPVRRGEQAGIQGFECKRNKMQVTNENINTIYRILNQIISPESLNP